MKNSDESYYKTLTAYKNDNTLYKEVVWISPTRSIRNKIEKIAQEIGFTETGRIRVIPLYYEHGEYDNPMWLL